MSLANSQLCMSGIHCGIQLLSNSYIYYYIYPVALFICKKEDKGEKEVLVINWDNAE